MFKKKAQPEPSGIQKRIDELVEQMKDIDGADPQYAKMTDQLTKLHKLKMDESPEHVSKNTLITVLGNLAVVLVIVGHERTHVITSRAGQFLQKATR